MELVEETNGSKRLELSLSEFRFYCREARELGVNFDIYLVGLLAERGLPTYQLVSVDLTETHEFP